MVLNEARGSVVRFEAVGLRYGTGPEILGDLSFTLTDGSFHFLTGARGAGKSSVLRLMSLALAPTRGAVTLFGHPAATLPRTEMPRLRRRIGVVFQDFRLLPDLTAFDNVALPLRIAGIKEREIEKNVAEILSWVGLSDQFNALPATLSAAQLQLVAIARAVIGRPTLLLADEPTGNVDDHMAMRLMHLFEELNRVGTTVVVATCSQALAGRYRHPRLHLEAGRMKGAPATLAPPRPGAGAAAVGKRGRG
jgi:cell division transport system ATP-binding protein